MPKLPDGFLSAATLRQGRKERVFRTPMGAVIGIESEFAVYVQEEKCRPEHVFRSPQQIVREKMIPREGRSYHLPSGGALYFDSGVIEVATPIIELEPGCSVRAVRSLWEQIRYLRTELDAWEKAHQASVRLEGFSTHYNLSVARELRLSEESQHRLALLLTYLLPAPVMLLAANKLSTGVGVRPRPQRIEVTVDFTPDPELMAATAALIVGIAHAVSHWPSFHLSELRDRNFPVIRGFHPRKHTSRKGFLAREDCYPENPFAADPNDRLWELTDGRTVNLRDIAIEIAEPFRDSIERYADPQTVDHLFAVLEGRARSLLDFSNRPGRYEDVGRVVDWKRREHPGIPRSKYEKVIHRIITHRPILVDGHAYAPERMQGWYEVVFRDTANGRRRVFNLDDLVRHCAV